MSERVLAQFLAEMEGVEELKGVLVLGATNRPDMIDPAILRPGRFDEVVEIPMPDEQGRQEIFGVHLRGKPLAPGIDIRKLAARAEGLSGADIAGVCRQAAVAAVRRVVEAAGDNPPSNGVARFTSIAPLLPGCRAVTSLPDAD